MNDLISRQAAIELACMRCKNCERQDCEYKDSCETMKLLDALPSAQPERMRGRWQEITASDCSGYDPVLAGYDDPVVGYVCSVCHEGYEKEVMGKTTWDVCPNCGARMDGEEDETD